MEKPNPPRNRAVRLTEEGARVLAAALLERWRQSGQAGKLTREARARALGVSVVTADKVLGGRGVDRSTLLYVFGNMGLAWSEGYLAAEAREPAAAMPPAPEPPAKRRLIAYWPAAAGMAALLALAAAVFAMLAPPKDPGWLHPFGQHLTAGTSAYQRGDYDSAERHLAKAVSLARAHKSAPHMSSALRMTADVAAARGSLDDAVDAYRRVLALRVVFSEENSEPAVREALAGVLIKLGRYSEASAELRTAKELFRRYRDPMGVALVHRTEAVLALARRDADAAEGFVRAAFAADPRVAASDLASDLRIQQAGAAEQRGQLARARELLEGELAYWRAKNHPRWIAGLELRIGSLDLKQGNVAKARAQFASSLMRYEAVGDRRGVMLAKQRLKSL